MTTTAIGRVGDYIREQREAAAISVRRLAQEAGVSNPYLSQVERGLRKPSAEVLQQIAKALRISAEQLYVRAGLLEDRGTPSEVEAAILSDESLSDRHKRALLDIYASFRAEAPSRRSAGPGPAAETAEPAASNEDPGTATPTTPRSTRTTTKG
jgi:transcriptional regulator with XRE-family HTH domain